MIRFDAILNDWQDAVRTTLRHHGVFIMPTDTVYGFSCDARDAEAVRTVFRLKQRPTSKAMLVVASSLEMVKRVCTVTEDFEEWIEQYWPGPLTTILQARKGLFAKEVLPPNLTVAIRVPDSEIARECVEINGFPLVSSSVNRSSQPPMRSVSRIMEEFGVEEAEPEVLLDIGDIPDVLPTTIVDCTKRPWCILRNGSLIPIFPHAA